ncbi:MAG TPA: Type 1 glutamine amidotransferase-like domain-containing protein [Gaiellaceae bacterium]
MRLFLGSSGLGALQGFLGEAREVLYVPTAAKPMPDQASAGVSRKTLGALGYRVVELDIDDIEESELSALGSVDAVFVEGGSPFFLLQAMRESGFDAAVTEAVHRGLPYVGMSAGAVVAGPDLEPLAATSNTGLGPRLQSTKALGLVDAVVFPHHNAPDRASDFEEARERYGSKFELVPLADTEALIVDDDGTRVVPSELQG